MNWCPGVSAELKTIFMSGLFTILGPDSLLGSVFFGDANICKFVHVWFASFNTHHLHMITPKLGSLCLKLMSPYKGRGSEHQKREMDKHMLSLPNKRLNLKLKNLFSINLISYFKCWLGALEISTFDDLCELKILEQFKNMLPAEVAI